MRLSARQIELFQMAFRLRSTRKAADALHISQPAVSRAVAEIEAEIGVQLFDRSGRKFEPTLAAKSLHDAVQRHYHGLERVIEAARLIAEGITGHLRVVALPAVADALVARAAGRLMVRHAGLRVDVDVMGERECLAALKSGRADCAVISTDPGEASLSCHRVGEIAPVVAVPGNAAQSRQKAISTVDLVRQPMVMLPGDSPFRRSVEKLLADSALSFIVRAEARSQSALLEYVAQGVGWAIVDPKMSVVGLDIVLVPLQADLIWPIHAVAPMATVEAPVMRQFLKELGQGKTWRDESVLPPAGTAPHR